MTIIYSMVIRGGGDARLGRLWLWLLGVGVVGVGVVGVACSTPCLGHLKE
jgi:hypothetical protein